MPTVFETQTLEQSPEEEFEERSGISKETFVNRMEAGSSELWSQTEDVLREDLKKLSGVAEEVKEGVEGLGRSVKDFCASSAMRMPEQRELSD